MEITDSNAFAETLFIIKCLPHNERSKIPIKFIEFLNENKNDDYVVDINPNVGLENQKLLEETKELLKEIYISYFISNEEKKRILQYDQYRNILEEDVKNTTYKYNDIFKIKPVDALGEEKNIENSLSIVKYKETFFTKFKNFIFKILCISK